MADAREIPDSEGAYTYADYEKWPEYPRCELYGGKIYMMSAPSIEHQRISMALSFEFSLYLQGKTCQVFAAPADVLLFADENGNDDEDDDNGTVLQPDLFVVCDSRKIAKNYCRGAPDLVVEIISPSNTSGDILRKFNYYLDAGVREYWVVDPTTRTVQVHVYQDGRYLSTVYKEGAAASSAVLPGFTVGLDRLFPPAA